MLRLSKMSNDKLLDERQDLEQAQKGKKKLDKLNRDEVSTAALLFWWWKLLQPYLPEIRGMKNSI